MSSKGKYFLSKSILILLLLNIFFPNKIHSQEIDPHIELDIEDHLKGEIDTEEIRKNMKLKFVDGNEEADNNTLIINQTEGKANNENEQAQNQTISFSASKNSEEIKEEEKPRNPEDIFEEIKGAYRIRSNQEMQFLLEIEDLVFLKFSYRSSSKASISVAKYIKSISEKLEYLAGFVMIDCDSYTPEWSDDCAIDTTGEDPFPKMRLYIPPEKRYDQLLDSWAVHSEVPYTDKEINESKIYNFIVNYLPNKSTNLNKNNDYSFLRGNAMNKIILFTDKPNPTILFKGLSNYFYDRISFGVVKKEETEILEKFKITRFPTLMIYKTIDRERFLDEPETIFFKGLTKAQNLVEFIEPHTLQEKFHYRQKRGIKEHNVRNMGVNMSFGKMTPANYENIFEKYGDRNIVVYFDKKMRMKKSYKHYLIKN